MHTKLTLRLDETLIARAKAWSDQQGISLSQAVADLFSQISIAGPETQTVTPWTRQLVGVAGPRSDDEVRELVRHRIGRKHS
jgi:hypothetical protein